MSIKEDDLPTIRRRKVVLPIKCGDCIFHKHMATYVKPCSELGTIASSDTCGRFIPDPRLLGNDAGRALRAVASAIRPMLLAASMLSAKRVARSGFKLGQRVYVHVTGGDYLNNYASGIVVGATADKVVVLGSEGYSALLSSEALIDSWAWSRVRARLVGADRINDPDGGLRRISVRGRERLIAYEPADMSGKKRTRQRGAKNVDKQGTKRKKRGSKVINLSV